MSFRFLDNDRIGQRMARGAGGVALKVFAGAAEEYFKEVVLPAVVDETPVDTGDLRSTEEVPPAEVKFGRILVGVVAGGPNAPHAYVVHETPGLNHPIGDWKYIERPLMAQAGSMASQIAKRIDLNKVLA